MMIRSRFACAAAAVLLWLAGVAPAYSAAPKDDVTSRPAIVYGHAGDQDLLLDVFMKATSEKDSSTSAGLRPALLLIHGGGWSGGSRQAYYPDATALARDGYVCFTVGYRLVKPDRNQYPTQIDDVQLAVRWVRAHAKEYGIDPHKVAAMGGSAGGHLVSLLGTCDTRDTQTAELRDYSSRVDCVIDFFGPADLTAPLPTRSWVNVQKLVSDLLGGDVATHMDLARDASPLFHIDQQTVPFLIIHGTDDPLVPLDQSNRFAAALRAAKREVELMIIDKGSHGFAPAQQRQAMNRVRAFLAKHAGR